MSLYLFLTMQKLTVLLLLEMSQSSSKNVETVPEVKDSAAVIWTQ